MKTTAEISDDSRKGEHELAVIRSTTLSHAPSQVCEEELAKVIDSSAKPARYKLPDLSFGGKGPAPKLTWEEIRAIIYAGRGE